MQPPVTPPRHTRKITVDDRNTHHFRVPVRATSAPRAESNANPNSNSSSPVQHTHHRLQTRFKTLVGDILQYMAGHAHDSALADEFVLLADDAIKSFKLAKVENGALFRRTKTTHAGEAHQLSVDSVDNNDVKAPSTAAKQAAKHVDPTKGADPEAPSRRKENAWVRPLSVNPKEAGDAPKERGDLAEERLRDALKSEEKLAEAEARRKLLAAERQQKLESQAERSSEARARREAKEHQLRTELEARAMKTALQRSQAVEKRKEFATKDAAKADEAAFVVAAETSNRAAELDEKLKATERNAEALQAQRYAVARERSEAREQVVARAKSADKQRAEHHQQRVTAKEEQRLRHEAEKQRESETKHQKSEERREKVLEQQQKAQAETDAKLSRAQERVELSEKLREEQSQKLKEKGEKQEQKLREAKERRDKEAHSRNLVAERLRERSTAEWKSADETVAKAVGWLAKQAKPFAEEHGSMPPSSSKSKCRAILGRLWPVLGPVPQVRSALHDLLSALASSSSAADFSALRWIGGINAVCDIFYSKKSVDVSVARLAGEVVVKFITQPSERKVNVDYFVKSGCASRLCESLLESVKRVHKSQTPGSLLVDMIAFFAVADYVLVDVGDRPEMQGYRSMVFDVFDAADVFNFSLALAAVAQPEDMQLLFMSLCCVRSVFIARRKDVVSQRNLHDRMCHSLLACATNMLMPGGQIRRQESAMPEWGTPVLFMAFRLLNDVARRDLRMMQSIVSSDMASTAFPHVVMALTTYLTHHESELERLPPPTIDVSELGPSKQLADALKSGLTVSRVWSLDMFGHQRKPPHLLRAAFHELLLLIGYLAINNSAFQDVFAYGITTPLLCSVVSALPIAYFGVSKAVAFPSLLAVCFRHRLNTSILRSEMDSMALTLFLRAEMEAYGVPAQAAQRTPQAQPQRISWAEMMDDDEADFITLPADPAEGERMASHVAKAVVARRDVDYATFFRFDRRLATELWAEVLADLEMSDH